MDALFRPDPRHTYRSLYDGFSWHVPDRLNIGRMCTDDQIGAHPALITHRADGDVETTTFAELSDMTTRFANVLVGLGLERGDRVGIVLPQSRAVLVSHLGAHKAGMVALPLAVLFGPDALRYRLEDSAARVVVTNPAMIDVVQEAAAGLELRIIVVGDAVVAGPLLSFEGVLRAASPRPIAVATAAEDPATLIYTSGTTGPPKGALHAHRFLYGHFPSFELYYDFFPQPADVIWTPADWAWIGALMDVVIPALAYGKPVLTAEQPRFDPEFAGDLMAEHRVTSAFIPPTALKMMRAAGIERSDLTLRSIFTGGEALGEETLAWAGASLGTVINEGYGQTEANIVVGNSAGVWDVRPGSMGRPMPGHDVAVVDQGGNRLLGEVGEVAVRTPNPVAMLEYWRQPEATARKYNGEWLLTGDLAVQDEEGYLWFESRKDDVIISMGYRIGPGEIEESLLGHPAVALAAAIGEPDDIRGAVVKAFVVPADGVVSSPALVEELRHHVRSRLAAHEVPRDIEFRTELPMTTTGKIMRRALRAESSKEGRA